MKRFFCFTLSLLSAGISVFAQSGYVHDAMEKKYGEPGADKLSEWMNGKLLNVKIEPEYQFPVSLSMHCTSYRKGDKKDETDMTYFINASNELFATKGGDGGRKKEDMLIIYDSKANAMLMLNQKDKTGMAFSLNAFMSGAAIEKREQEKAGRGKAASNTSCKKTGKTKTVMGYSCEEYVCVDVERNTRSEIWITNKLPVDIAASGMRGPMAMYFRNAGNLGGMMMESSFYKNDQLEMTMVVTDVNNHADLLIRSGDYKFNNR